jgi:23S rRNA (guanosine2251-2'-O)-methyltransferase
MKETIYSRNAVYETLRARRRQPIRLLLADNLQEKGRLGEILQMARARKLPVERVQRHRLDSITPQHQGVVLETGHYPYVPLDDILKKAREANEPPFILLLDTLNDPQNFGTLIRTAEAVGVHGVVIPLARTVEVTPSVVNASSGASEHMLIAQANLAQAIDELKKADVWIVGLDQDGETVTQAAGRSPLSGTLGLVVGSEGEGMRPLVRKSCDFVLKLPMRGQIESLNAAVAGSVALYLAFLARTR